MIIFRYGQEAQKCYCGAENCRGWLGGNPDEDENVEDDDEEEEELETESESESSEEEIEEVVEKSKEISVETKEILDTSDELITDPVMPVVKPLPENHTKLEPLPKPKKIRRKLRRKSPRKIKNYEADDYEEDLLDKLKSTGVRTKAHTLELCRRMFQATDLNIKLVLCQLLRGADAPCKRLFIDYRGLRTIGHWVTDLTGSLELELDLMESVEDTLAVLTIPDQQVSPRITFL